MLLTYLFALALTQPPASACAVSDEPVFATTKDHAVQVGGGAMYVAARERRYLDALRGPTGEPLTYKRIGSLLGPDGHTILDGYEVTYIGLEKPITLYLDAYHYDDALKAPKGFVCAVPIALTPPPPDAFLALDSLVKLAIEQGASKDFEPIPLEPDVSSSRGFMLDFFRVIARTARAAAASSTPLDPKNPPRDLGRTRMIVVAYPVRCGDKAPVAPVTIDIVPGQGQPPPRRDGEIVSGGALARVLPGMDLPAGALGATYLMERPRPADTIRISYPDGSCGAANDVSLPVKYTNAHPLKTPSPALPAGQAATDRPVRLQAVIDADGAAQQIVYVGGPESLTAAAIEAVRGWTAEAARLNGAPIVVPVMLQVRFVPREP
jgi:hypothetical protein